MFDPQDSMGSTLERLARLLQKQKERETELLQGSIDMLSGVVRSAATTGAIATIAATITRALAALLSFGLFVLSLWGLIVRDFERVPFRWPGIAALVVLALCALFSGSLFLAGGKRKVDEDDDESNDDEA